MGRALGWGSAWTLQSEAHPSLPAASAQHLDLCSFKQLERKTGARSGWDGPAVSS